MKKIIALISLIVFLSNVSFSQDKYNVDIIYDSLNKSKSDLYSITKQFIAESFVSSNSVIQNDDKEIGLIYIKGKYVKSITYALNVYEYTYDINIKFYVKDNKCRVIVESVECSNAISITNYYKIPLIQIYNAYPGNSKSYVSEKKYNEVVTSVNNMVLTIIKNYEHDIKESTSLEKW